MRRVIWLILGVALLWSAWWGVATFGVARGIEGWLSARQTEGWQAETSAITSGGYPKDIRVTVKDIALADPDTGAAVQASSLQVQAPVWDPGTVTLDLPKDPILLASPEGRSRLLMQKGQARLAVTPTASLALEQMEATADAWLLDAEAGDILAGGTSRLSVVQDPEMAAKYRFEMGIDALRPGEVPRRALYIPLDWPVTFDQFALNTTVIFDRSWDITALEVSRPQPRQIVIHSAEAAWGALQLRFAAALDVDVQGTASGTLNVQARNWRSMLILAETSGALRPQIEQALSTFAGLAGNPETLDLALTLRGGTVFLGFLPLGPAPRLILR
ncbi:MAG: DUF2125 domain-containing protein [Paracoccaceae bacterium]|nr:DUF2125 domain-containing protein [Paracoccaceae bacterium]